MRYQNLTQDNKISREDIKKQDSGVQVVGVKDDYIRCTEKQAVGGMKFAVCRYCGSVTPESTYESFGYTHTNKCDLNEGDS